MFAAEAGWAFPVSYGELMGALHYAAFMQVHTDDGKGAQVPFPWSDVSAQEVVSAEERRIAEEYLAAHTAIRS